MSKLPEGRKPLTMEDLTSLDIMQNDIYDTTAIRESDGEMEIFLHDLARKENSDFIRRVADRFAELTKTAHNRKHWTGHE